MIVHYRIYDKLLPHVDENNFGFLRGRGRELQLWDYAWSLATMKRLKMSTHVTGLDLRRAFDTVDRVKLMDELTSLSNEDGRRTLNDDDLRMLRILLATNVANVRVGKVMGEQFNVDIGTPIGDCISPLLFIFYLARALKQVRDQWKIDRDSYLNFVIRCYADDVDIMHNSEWTENEHDELKQLINITMGKWGMMLNDDKEESYYLSGKREDYVDIKKLGVMLDKGRHIQMVIRNAQNTFNRYWPLWYKRNRINKKVKMQFYNAFVLPHFMNGMFLHVLNKGDMHRLDVVHRKHLRRITHTHYPHHIANVHLYQLAGAKRLEHYFMKQRWKLFGTSLGNVNSVVFSGMSYFFAKPTKYGLKNPKSLPGLLNK
jgi:hypothetical protein